MEKINEMFLKSTNIEEMKTLLKLGVDVNLKSKSGETALIWSIRYGHREIVEMLLGVPDIDANAKNQSGDTALIYTSRYGNKDIVKMLLEAPDIDANAKNQSGETALMLASAYGRGEIVKMLKDHIAKTEISPQTVTINVPKGTKVIIVEF